MLRVEAIGNCGLVAHQLTHTLVECVSTTTSTEARHLIQRVMSGVALAEAICCIGFLFVCSHGLDVLLRGYSLASFSRKGFKRSGFCVSVKESE